MSAWAYRALRHVPTSRRRCVLAAARLTCHLAAAGVGNCLSASLLFALRTFKQAPDPLSCSVRAEVGRSAAGRWRALAMKVRLRLGVPPTSLKHLGRVQATLEACCPPRKV